MVYNPNIPIASDLLSDSQGDLLANFVALDAVYGTDHYAFSNATSNSGFHNVVTTPLIVGSAHPTTLANIPKFYAMQDSSNLGVIQYSRGPSDAVPSPVTILQSPSTAITINAGNTSDVFNFTGLSKAMCALFAMDTVLPTGNEFQVFWTGSVLLILPFAASTFTAISAGSILQIKNNAAFNFTSVFWSLQFLRTS